MIITTIFISETDYFAQSVLVDRKIAVLRQETEGFAEFGFLD